MLQKSALLGIPEVVVRAAVGTAVMAVVAVVVGHPLGPGKSQDEPLIICLVQLITSNHTDSVHVISLPAATAAGHFDFW